MLADGTLSGSTAHERVGLIRGADLGLLRRAARQRAVAAGTLLAAAGGEAREVFVVVDGEVELFAKTQSGRVGFALVRSGGVIGDVPLLLRSPVPFDAVTTRATTVLVLSRPRWIQLLTSSPRLALRWMTSIAERLDSDRRRLLAITGRSLDAQIAYLLLELAEPHDGGLVVRASHATVADLLGARRQSVTRTLGRMRRDGLIETGYRMTLLRDTDALRRLARA